MGQVLRGNPGAVVPHHNLGIQGIFLGGNPDFSSGWGVLHAVFQHIPQRLAGPFHIPIKVPLGFCIKGNVPQLHGHQEGFRCLVNQGFQRNFLLLQLHHARIQLGHFQKHRYQPVNPLKQAPQFPKKLGFPLGRLVLLPQKLHQKVNGGKGRSYLVGDVRQGVCQVDFFFQEALVLLPEADGHFLNLAFQNSQLPFLAAVQKNLRTAMENPVNLLPHGTNPAVTPGGSAQENAIKEDGKKQQANRRIQVPPIPGKAAAKDCQSRHDPASQAHIGISQ